jgi:competence protein ComEA
LPGIGPALAARIVQWREQNGRFTAVDELLEVSGIGPARYDAIAGLVTL